MNNDEVIKTVTGERDQADKDRVAAIAHRMGIPAKDPFCVLITVCDGYFSLFQEIPDKIKEQGAVVVSSISDAAASHAASAVHKETARALAHLHAASKSVIEQTAQDAQKFAPTAYKFRATAAIAALALTVCWMAYGYGVLHSTKRFYVTEPIENSNYVKSFRIQNVKVQGIDVNQVVYDGKSVLFVPASDNAADATKGWLKSKMSTKNPGLMAIVGGLIGSIATIIYINSHYIMLAGERGINRWLNKKP